MLFSTHHMTPGHSLLIILDLRLQPSQKKHKHTTAHAEADKELPVSPPKSLQEASLADRRAQIMVLAWFRHVPPADPDVSSMRPIDPALPTSRQQLVLFHL